MATERGGKKEPSCKRQKDINGKAAMKDGKHFEKVHKAAALSFFWAHVHGREARVRQADQVNFYVRVKTIQMGEIRNCSSQFITTSAHFLFGDFQLTHNRWVRWLHNLLKIKLPKLDPNIAKDIH